MDNIPLGLTGFGFWLAVALVAIAIIWAVIKSQQMKHELKLKLLERGRDVDQELLAKLLVSDKSGVPFQQKSIAEQHRDGGYLVGLIFLVAGLGIALSGVLRDHGLSSWLQIGLGAFSFAFGWLCWTGTEKEYQRHKAEEKLSRD